MAVGILATTMAACKSEERSLAEKMTGEWVGTPEEVTDHAAVTASITETYFFAPDSAYTPDGKHPVGPLTIQSTLTMSTQIMAEGDGAMPMGLTASAIATAKGSWTVIDDDEVTLTIDPRTISVTVDPSSLTTSPAGVTEPAENTLSPQMVKSLEQSLTKALTMRYSGMRLMEDVKVKGALLKYEVGHTDYVLTRGV